MKISKIALFGMTFVVATAAVFVTAAQARAESPNIIVGQDLALGSSGQSVVVLQALLSEMGYLNVPVGIPLGYYGSMTKNAVAAYQSRINVYPAVGYYGDLTKSAMRSDFASHGYLRILGW